MVNQYFFETICSGDVIYETDEIFGTTLRKTEEAGATQCKGIDTKV